MSQETEWASILREKGIGPYAHAKEMAITEASLTSMMDQIIEEKQTKRAIHSKGSSASPSPERGLSSSSSSSLTSSDPDLSFSDEEDPSSRLYQYRKQRLQELQRPHFGQVNYIRPDEFKSEVNEAGKNIWVVIHLMQSYWEPCQFIQPHLITLARHYPTTKFLWMKSTECIPKYPDHHLPTLLLYFEGQLKHHLQGSQVMNSHAQQPRLSDLEELLHRYQAI